MERNARATVGRDFSQCDLHTERLSAWCGVYGGVLFALPPTQGWHGLESPRLPRTYGIVVLHNAIFDWDFTVLRHRIWVRHKRWTYNDRSNCGGSVWRRSGVLRALAEVVQLRRIGMDLADADVWEVDEVAERVKRLLKSVIICGIAFFFIDSADYNLDLKKNTVYLRY